MKGAIGLVVSKDKYEDLVESTKSNLRLHYAELDQPNISALGSANTSVPLGMISR